MYIVIAVVVIFAFCYYFYLRDKKKEEMEKKGEVEHKWVITQNSNWLLLYLIFVKTTEIIRILKFLF